MEVQLDPRQRARRAKAGAIMILVAGVLLGMLLGLSFVLGLVNRGFI